MSPGGHSCSQRCRSPPDDIYLIMRIPCLWGTPKKHYSRPALRIMPKLKPGPLGKNKWARVPLRHGGANVTWRTSCSQGCRSLPDDIYLERGAHAPGEFLASTRPLVLRKLKKQLLTPIFPSDL